MNAKRRVLLCVGLLATLASVAVPLIASSLPSTVPVSATPAELHVSAILPRTTRTLSFVSEDEYLRVIVSMSTASKRVHLRWDGKANAGAWKSTIFTYETVSFEPTALCRSRTNERVFYIAGRTATAPKLEKWEIDSDYGLAIHWEPNPGIWKTSIETAGVTKTSIPVSNGLQNVTDMTAITPSPVSGQAEEVWVMEWETRNVYAVSLTTGALTLRVSNTITAPYRSMNGRTHSSYGDCVFFDRQPWNMNVMDWTAFVAADPTLDTNRLVLYDQDLNGTMEGSMTISESEYATHAIYTTGQFTDDTP